MSSTMSVLGLYQWDKSLLDGVVKYLPTPAKIPTDYPDLYYPGDVIDADMFKNNLLMECAELEVVYPDFNFLKWAIETWALKEKNVWQKFYNTCYYKYNPLWNKDGKITRTETETRDLQNNTSRDLQNSEQTQEETTQTRGDTGDVQVTASNTNDITVTNQVSPFNDADFKNRDKTETSDNSSGEQTTTQNLNSTGNANTTGTTTSKNTGTVNVNDTGTIKRTYEDLEQGNIGITMSQQMAQAERDYVKFNIVDYIIDDFKKRFCILVY